MTRSATAALRWLSIAWVASHVAVVAEDTPNLEQVLLYDILESYIGAPNVAPSCNMDTTGTDSPTSSSFVFPGTRAASDWDPTNGAFEEGMFAAEMSHADPDDDKLSWSIRIGTGGSMYSHFVEHGHGETMPKQDQARSPFMDEVQQTVAVINAGAYASPACYIHQAGTYQKDAPKTNVPFFSPSLAKHCDGHSCVFASWGQQAHLPTRWTSPIIYITKYTNCGGGVIEITQMMHNFSPVVVAATDYLYFNVGWGGVRTSNLPFAIEPKSDESFPIDEANINHRNLCPWGYDDPSSGTSQRQFVTSLEGYTTFADNSLRISHTRRDGDIIQLPAGMSLRVPANTAARCDSPTTWNGYRQLRCKFHETGFGNLGTYLRSYDTCAPFGDKIGFRNSVTEEILTVLYVRHWSWSSDEYVHFVVDETNKNNAVNIANAMFDNSGSNVELPIELVPVLHQPATPPESYNPSDVSTFTFVYGDGSEYNGSTKRVPLGRLRRRFGQSSRDYIVFTINWYSRGTKLRAGETYYNRSFMFSNTLGNVKTVADSIKGQTYSNSINMEDWNPRSVDIYIEGTSFTVVAAASRQGVTTECNDGTKIAGKSTPQANHRPVFFIKCGSQHLLRFDPYEFAAFDDFPNHSTGTNYVRPYELCDDDERPQWNMMGFFPQDAALPETSLTRDDSICGPTPTSSPSKAPSQAPSTSPTTPSPTTSPSTSPTSSPSKAPSQAPSTSPTGPVPTTSPSTSPTSSPSKAPSQAPSTSPTTSSPTTSPSTSPTSSPSKAPSQAPSTSPTTSSPTTSPSTSPTSSPSKAPSQAPSTSPTTLSPTKIPTTSPTSSPTNKPTLDPRTQVVEVEVTRVTQKVETKVTVTSTIQMNIVVPTDSDDRNALVNVLKATIISLLEQNLADNQSIDSVAIISIGGQSINSRLLFHRLLENEGVVWSSVVAEETTVTTVTDQDGNILQTEVNGEEAQVSDDVGESDIVGSVVQTDTIASLIVSQVSSAIVAATTSDSSGDSLFVSAFVAEAEELDVTDVVDTNIVVEPVVSFQDQVATITQAVTATETATDTITISKVTKAEVVGKIIFSNTVISQEHMSVFVEKTKSEIKKIVFNDGFSKCEVSVGVNGQPVSRHLRERSRSMQESSSMDVDFTIAIEEICVSVCSDSSALSTQVTGLLNVAIDNGSFVESLQGSSATLMTLLANAIATRSVVPTPGAPSNWYPDWRSSSRSICLNDGNEPTYMKIFGNYYENSLDACCKRYYAWDLITCTGDAVTVPSGFYPNWGTSETKCFNSTETPETLPYNLKIWLDTDIESCCERNFNWAYNDCIYLSSGSLNIAATNKWYVNHQEEICQKDCLKNGGGSCGGLVDPWKTLFDTSAACCKEKLSWITSTTCESHSMLLPVVGTSQWYVDWPSQKCVKDCADSSDVNCGGLASQFDPKYSSSSECCDRIWYVGQRECTLG